MLLIISLIVISEIGLNILKAIGKNNCCNTIKIAMKLLKKIEYHWFN